MYQFDERNVIEIVRVAIEDVVSLQQISRQTFVEAFFATNTEENMKKYLEENLALETLTNELNNENSEFYFALCNTKVIGYLKLNFGLSQTELQDSKAIEIERIYVLKDFYGKSVGKLLYEKATQIAQQKKVEYLWLGVWEENSRAINFYRKNGFVEFDRHIFKLGDELQTDIMMKLDL